LRCKAGCNGRIGQGIAELSESYAADFFFVEFEIVAKATGHLFQHTNGLRDYFRTDPVTGEGSDTELHAILESF
jgi:hypothetical protein